MKKRMMTVFFAGLLCTSLLLGGCTSKSEEKAQEYKELGIKQMQDEDYESAVESFQKALDQSLGKVRAQEIDVSYYKALAQYKAGDIEDALETYNNLAEYDEDNWEVYYLRGCVYLADAQTDQAVSDYKKAVSLNGKDPQLYGYICENLQNAGATDQAQTFLTDGLKIEPSSAEDYESIGYLYMLSGDADQAESAFRQAIEKGADSAYLQLGKLYLSADNTDAAKTAFASYMEKHADDADALQELGNIAYNAGDYADAVTYYTSALEAAGDSNTQLIQKTLVSSCEKAGDYEAALAAAKTYVKAYPDDADMAKEYEFLQTRVNTQEQETVTDTAENGSESADQSAEESGQ